MKILKNLFFKNDKILSNEKPTPQKIEKAKTILFELQTEAAKKIEEGFGPFVAAIYDKDGNQLVMSANSVIAEQCSNCHAEMNAIKAAQQKLGTFNLAPHDLSLYVTSEPCIMCIGGILWSGIKEVYFGVPSSQVEKITGFDEGFKKNWIKEFKKRGITVYGNIESNAGEAVLKKYVKEGKTVYKPQR